MMPEAMPKVSCRTLTTGARQLVVQLAFEMTLCLAGSYLSEFTPRTMVRSSFVAGAEMMTFLTVDPKLRAGLGSIREEGRWDSTTISAPTEAPVELGRIALRRRPSCVLPSTMMSWPSTEISFFRLPRMESYLSRWARVAGGGQVIDGNEFDVGFTEGRCGRRCGRCGRSR